MLDWFVNVIYLKVSRKWHSHHESPLENYI